jgi:acetate kinase
VEDIRALAELAPLHNEVAAGVLEAALERAPRVPLLAVFDTAFHRTLPEVARRYALPDEAGADVRRHGFHGIAHRWASTELYRLAGRGPSGTRAVSCHLGGGASLCALADGVSVDTSMGLTPLEGLMMSTRSGDLDPGAVLHLLRHGRSLEEVHEMLHRKSGLLGLSGTSGDLRALEPAAAAGDARAAFALDAYAYRFRKLLGGYAVALGGLDLVVLSGALAENWAPFRARLLAGLELLGLSLDARRNAAARADAPARLDADGSRVEVWLVPADEERELARQALGLAS